MSLNELLQQLKAKQIVFKDVLAYIDAHYIYSPSAFKNGDQNNAETENQGSARVLSFAKLNNLSQDDTLALFAEHYDAVLSTPEATDHQNIRQFMLHGWNGVYFENTVLVEK
ncbi:HopJ type III effector protein [Sphingobacterium bovistauri]|uniref:HopJ type III effector protein n=1 Tax=Sphingobacterium bovistauri TaxID=2781959 RepID=A0ABS7Z525_9SPHI|nr:HopJ type III effector protein [Sphingobacterium bovistauri]MCA5005118.1 HopJ type III effector protein [Sphingobacterium bovistauri]